MWSVGLDRQRENRAATKLIAISITPTAYDAIQNESLPRIAAEPQPGPDGYVRIWLDRQFVDLLSAMRGPGESYSDVILRLAKA